MKDFNFIMEQFKSKHSEIDSKEYLEKYINFLIDYEAQVFEEYSERHHILPRRTFPEFENAEWNIVNLKYEDHKLVHLWLFKSINERVYQKPLNFMIKEYKNSQELSKATKRGWIKLKNNKEKYEKWCKKRSEHMSSLSSEERTRRLNIHWSNISDDDYSKFCKKMSDYWTEERKIEKAKEMKDFFSTEENVQKKREESTLIWENRDEDFRINFRNKMEKINKDEEKRRDAGEKIKLLWKSENYLNKMKNRKKREGVKLKLIHINGTEVVIESMRKFKEIYNFSEHLIRKYRNTNKFISIDDLNESNIELKNYKIETING